MILGLDIIRQNKSNQLMVHINSGD